MKQGRRPAGAFWPTPTQELLLRAALAPDAEGRRAWRELGPEFDLHTLAPGTISILPLLYRRLLTDAPDDPRLPHLKGVYRNTWVRNNLLAEQLTAILAAFRAAEVPVVLVGSLGAALRYYADLGLRPTPALDLLVPGPAMPAAQRALGLLSFSGESVAEADGPPVVLHNAAGQACVLRSAAADELELGHDAVAATGVTIEIGGEDVHAPEPALDLVAACVGGARVKPVRSIQWLVDMSRIAATLTPTEWERVWGIAATYGQDLRLERSLTYLAMVSATPLPIEHHAVPARERLAYRLSGSDTARLGSFPHALGAHLVATRNDSPRAALAALPNFLLRRWGLEHVRQIPLAGGRRALRRPDGRETGSL
jgi:hypothetical protein